MVVASLKNDLHTFTDSVTHKKGSVELIRASSTKKHQASNAPTQAQTGQQTLLTASLQTNYRIVTQLVDKTRKSTVYTC